MSDSPGNNQEKIQKLLDKIEQLESTFEGSHDYASEFGSYSDEFIRLSKKSKIYFFIPIVAVVVAILAVVVSSYQIATASIRDQVSSSVRDIASDVVGSDLQSIQNRIQDIERELNYVAGALDAARENLDDVEVVKALADAESERQELSRELELLKGAIGNDFDRAMQLPIINERIKSIDRVYSVELESVRDRLSQLVTIALAMLAVVGGVMAAIMGTILAAVLPARKHGRNYPKVGKVLPELRNGAED